MLRLYGQKRVPTPPAINTTCKFLFICHCKNNISGFGPFTDINDVLPSNHEEFLDNF
jgi:hypothetical protein